MPRSGTKVFKKHRGTFFKGRTAETQLAPEPEQNQNVPSLCASEKKINLNESYKENNHSMYHNVIMDLNMLATVFSEQVKCSHCEQKGLSLALRNNNCGAAVELELMCSSCNFNYNFFSSKKTNGTFEVNTRLVYAMRSIGKGAEAAKMFSGIMNLPPPPTKFASYNKKILVAAKEVCENTMLEAAKEAVIENEGNKDIAVAVDGTWQKRGFSSLNGVVTLTSVDTGKVLDVEILSKYCLCPNKRQHSESCKKNFDGYSGKMEVDGAVALFERSLEKYDVRYTNYLGDGDSKAFNAVAAANMYGDECPVTKLECIGHVMKRMGSRLRRLKQNMKGKKLSDGKPLSGKGRLTDVEIDRLQTYYGLAIRRNLSSVKDMRQAVWAIFLHKMSTDTKPQHDFCPAGAESWCGFKKAEHLKKIYVHKHSLPLPVVEALRPIFKDLSNPELLKKCVHGNTQNPNESVNHVIWSRVPKTTFVHIETLSFGTYDAISSFNKGSVTKLETLKLMNIEPGDYMTQAMYVFDKERLKKSQYANMMKTKEVRKEKRLKRKREEEELKNNVENLDYGAGMF